MTAQLPPQPTSPPPAAEDTRSARPSFEQRVEGFGRDVGAAGERIGREAELAGQRLAKDPSMQRAADTAARAWGLVVLAIGSWFLADVTLGMDMPAVAWADIWPLGLILLGVVIVLRGTVRRRA
jgi:hypothetical protein